MMADSAWSVLAGGITTLAGAGLSAWVTARREDRSWSRESQVRWDTEKFEIYTQFLLWLGNSAYLVSRIQVELHDLGQEPSIVQPTINEFITARNELRRRYQQVLLVASGDVAVQARLANEGITQLRLLGIGGSSVHTPEWKEAHARMDAARTAFRETVRSELAITHGLGGDQDS
jgi:hypothetical protein